MLYSKYLAPGILVFSYIAVTGYMYVFFFSDYHVFFQTPNKKLFNINRFFFQDGMWNVRTSIRFLFIYQKKRKAFFWSSTLRREYLETVCLQLRSCLFHANIPHWLLFTFAYWQVPSFCCVRLWSSRLLLPNKLAQIRTKNCCLENMS